MKRRNTILAVTPGDPDGIGPEVVWKTIRAGLSTPLLCIGAKAPFERLKASISEVSIEDILQRRFPKKQSKPTVNLLCAPEVLPGKFNKLNPSGASLPGYQCGWAIEKATELVMAGYASALVTGPISKERLISGGFNFPGHTEMLAHLCGSKKPVTMMLANEQIRVSLVTTHIPLKSVSDQLTRAKIRRCVNNTVSHLQSWWGIKHPRVAIAALNPHAGENGILGSEEKQVIEPEIRYLRSLAKNRYHIEGPFPADTLFAQIIWNQKKTKYDAIVCMYHDQGLIPVKLVDFPKTVNITLGLPMIRTSVDHGVGFDIAGKGIADSTSFESAVRLAIKLVSIKHKGV